MFLALLEIEIAKTFLLKSNWHEMVWRMCCIMTLLKLERWKNNPQRYLARFDPLRGYSLEFLKKEWRNSSLFSKISNSQLLLGAIWRGWN